MVRKVTARAFEEWIADDANERSVLEALTRGPLHTVAKQFGKPYTCLFEYFHSTPEREGRYTAAKKAWIEMRKGELVHKIDALPADREQVARLELESKIIDNQAKAYHRERWGERVQVEKTVSVTVDAGPATRLLRDMQRAAALEVEEVKALPAEVVREHTPG